MPLSVSMREKESKYSTSFLFLVKIYNLAEINSIIELYLNLKFQKRKFSFLQVYCIKVSESDEAIDLIRSSEVRIQINT